MKQIIIEGNKLLSGKVKIGGAKNSVVGLMPSSILANDIVRIKNVPNISDKNGLIEIMELLGAKITSVNNELTIDSTNIKNKCIPLELCEKLRASYYFMGVLLTKFKFVEIYLPGGCKIGERPIDFHLKGFEALGAKITNDGEKFTIKANNLIGCPITLDMPSVGATINIMFAALMAEGVTTINNAAKEPEIVNIANLLINMGADIKGVGTDKITIIGVSRLHGGNISVCPDRIEAGTYLIIGSLIGENFEVEGLIKEELQSLLDSFDRMNINYEVKNNSIIINKANNIKGINLKSSVYPGFPTDLGQPIHVLMTQANGVSNFDETIYENRMGHIKYLNKMGANITETGYKVTIEGKSILQGNNITAKDLRGGASLVLAGLIADGKTIINDVDHILRGYEKIIEKLTKLGANIKIVEI